jgi:hypothetical protein
MDINLMLRPDTVTKGLQSSSELNPDNTADEGKVHKNEEEYRLDCTFLIIEISSTSYL